MSSAAGMVQIRPGVAEYDLPRGDEQARVGWGYAARREGPADREQGEGIGRGARGSGSLGGTDCAEKRGAHLLIDLSSQPPSSGGRGRARSSPFFRPMRIDDDDEQDGAAGSTMTTPMTTAAYASSSADSLGMFIDSCPSCPPWPVSCFVSFFLSSGLPVNEAQWKLVPCTARRGAAVHGPTRLGGGQVLVSQEARQGGQKRGPTALHEKKRR